MKTVSSAVEIDASPERVWAILTDLPGHSSWDPFITSISGSLVPGQKINVMIHPPGSRPTSFKPTVTSVVENCELAWLGRLVMPGLFDGAHRFTLEPAQPGTKVQASESFSGLLVPFFRSLLQHTQQGFEQLNAALKRRAEESPAADQETRPPRAAIPGADPLLAKSAQVVRRGRWPADSWPASPTKSGEI